MWAGNRADIEEASSKARPMIGIVVSRKTDARAVGRNSWKRRVREIFREKQTELRPEAVCLVKVRTIQNKPTYAAMEQELVKLFKKTGAWA